MSHFPYQQNIDICCASFRKACGLCSLIEEILTKAGQKFKTQKHSDSWILQFDDVTLKFLPLTYFKDQAPSKAIDNNKIDHIDYMGENWSARSTPDKIKKMIEFLGE